MRITIVALGTALALCNLGPFCAAAHAQTRQSFVNHGKDPSSGRPS